MMVTHLGDDPTKVANEVADIEGAHAIFIYFGITL